MNIIDKIIPVNIYNRPKGTYVPKKICIHWTANPASGANNAAAYQMNVAKGVFKNYDPSYWTSSQYVIGINGEIIQCVPDDGYACAASNNNKGVIHIEVCIADIAGEFSAAAIKSLSELVPYLMKKYNIPKNNVVRHYDLTGKECPKYYVNQTRWNKLKATIIGASDTTESSSNEKVVKCTKKYKAISNARIRTIKSEFGSVTGNVKNGTIYDVDEITYINGILKWLHFKNGGYSMYVDTDNKTKLFSEVYITTTKTVNANCNFRSATVIDKSNVICVIPKGTAIKYVKYYDKVANGKTWCKVKYNNTYGWVAKECINF